MRKDFLPFGKPSFSELEEWAILGVLRSGWIGMGPETMAFERELAESVGVPEVVSVNSCTSALFLSLSVLGIQSGDEVIVPALTWCSTANAAIYLGAVPVFCDVDEDSMCVNWETIEPRITPKTRAVIVVHYGGRAVDVRAIRERLPSHISLIEDAAHALGAVYEDGSMVGSAGNLSCFSFYANKNLSCGEGGAIALNDPQQADRLRRLRLHALSTDAWKRFLNKEVFDMGLTELGYKMNFTDLQAAIGRVQLRRQGEFQVRRRAVVHRYKTELPRILPAIRWQDGLGSAGHAAHLFVVQLPIEQLDVTRDQFFLALRELNIGAAIHYSPLHTMPLYTAIRQQATLRNVERLSQRILTLPISASMTEEDAGDVVEAFSHVVAHQGVNRVAASVGSGGV